MKGIRFYAEYVHKDHVREREIAKRTGLAVFADTGRVIQGYGYTAYDCACSVTNNPDNGYWMSTCGDDYLADKCRRISEKQARALFPELFAYLAK